MVSAIESTIDQTRHPGMKRTWVGSPDRFQITNMAHHRHVGRSVERDGLATSPAIDLLPLRSFLARPRAREPLKAMPRPVVKEATGEAKDGSFQEQSACELGVSNVAVLGFRRFLFVDQAPDLLEDLLSDQASQKAADDADGEEEELHGSGQDALWGGSSWSTVVALSNRIEQLASELLAGC
jgi:hypothetical protein